MTMLKQKDTAPRLRAARDGAHTLTESAAQRFTLLGPDRQPYPSAIPGTLGGHRGRKIYGRLTCPAALRAIARGGYVRYRVFFADEATAIAAGYRPCAICCPERYHDWKTAHTERGL